MEILVGDRFKALDDIFPAGCLAAHELVELFNALYKQFIAKLVFKHMKKHAAFGVTYSAPGLLVCRKTLSAGKLLQRYRIGFIYITKVFNDLVLAEHRILATILGIEMISQV